jgi:hypothetical protein
MVHNTGFLKVSTTVTIMMGPFLDKTDQVTIEDGLAITQAEVEISKNGAAMAAKTESTSMAHDTGGYYTCVLDAPDVDTKGLLTIMPLDAANEHAPVRGDYYVLASNVYDTMFGTDQFDVNVAAATAGAIAAGVIAAGGFTAGCFAANAIDATALAATAVDEIWDEAMDGTRTARQMLGITIPAFVAGKVTGGGTTGVTFRDMDDDFDAIVMTVDENGNRSTLTIAYTA